MRTLSLVYEMCAPELWEMQSLQYQREVQVFLQANCAMHELRTSRNLNFFFCLTMILTVFSRLSKSIFQDRRAGQQFISQDRSAGQQSEKKLCRRPFSRGLRHDGNSLTWRRVFLKQSPSLNVR